MATPLSESVARVQEHLTRPVLALGFLALSLSAGPGFAQDARSGFVGLRATCDVVLPEVGGYDSCLSAEAFGRLFLSRAVALELSVGRRHVSVTEFGGRSSSSFALTEYPVLLGSSYVLAADWRFRPRLAAGFLVGPYSTSFSSFVFPGPAASGSKSSVVFGAFAGVGFQALLFQALHLDGGAQYVYNPISAPGSAVRDQSYLSVSLGLAYGFH